MIPILGAVIPLVSSIIDRLIPDKNAAAKAKLELLTLETNGELNSMMKQLDVNMKEAEHKSIFVAGARPFILWMCGVIFGYHFLLHPILLTTAALSGFDVSVLPQFDIHAIWPVLGGLLGLGGFRTYEKYKGVAK